MEQMLIHADDVEKQICPVLLTLTEADSGDDFRTEAVGVSACCPLQCKKILFHFMWPFYCRCFFSYFKEFFLKNKKNPKFRLICDNQIFLHFCSFLISNIQKLLKFCRIFVTNITKSARYLLSRRGYNF